MRGDEIQPATAEGGDARERRGPRHAAPRKSLLTRLQRPAGKAFALAAMPTAVFVGMGLTPKPALADEKDIPFAPGPCVTRSDEPVEEESPKPTESAKPSESPSADESPAPEPSPSATSGTEANDGRDGEPKPSESPSAGAAQDGGKAADKSADKGGEAADQAPAPEPSESRHPLDPLGLGEKLKDLFDPDKDEERSPDPAESTAPAEKPSQKPAEEPADTPSKKPAEQPSQKPSAKPSEEPAEKPETPADRTERAIRDAADKAGATVEELDEDAKGLQARPDEDIPDGAKPRFPCPTPDPEALAAAEGEPGIPLLPDEPWVLESSMLTLTGLDYHGIVEVKTSSGKIKKVLKFTASGVDIRDLHQITVGPDGTQGHVKARSGSTSTIRNGTVTMYTEQLKGNLFGIIPITFSPQTPPPLNVPFAMFTDVTVKQAGQFGGTLTVPGLHNYLARPGN
ncbi:hypothetical protein [Streptomyces sp. NPDC005805]|uniref:hypothetical protein n=1 Tax=Streptomyces sp. NPDC005805 TaxID=3157068 RepID=UPI0033FE838B